MREKGDTGCCEVVIGMHAGAGTMSRYRREMMLAEGQGVREMIAEGVGLRSEAGGRWE
jgi:hypothetical protein